MNLGLSWQRSGWESDRGEVCLQHRMMGIEVVRPVLPTGTKTIPSLSQPKSTHMQTHPHLFCRALGLPWNIPSRVCWILGYMKRSSPWFWEMCNLLERSDRMWSTGEGNGKSLQYSCLENPTNSMKRQNDRILKEKLPRSVGAQYATGDQWRHNSRKNEGMEPKQKEYPAVDVIGDRSKVRCYKEQYCIRTWNVRSTNQGKLEVVK